MGYTTHPLVNILIFKTVQTGYQLKPLHKSSLILHQNTRFSTSDKTAENACAPRGIFYQCDNANIWNHASAR